MFVAGGLIWANVRPVIVTINEREYGRTTENKPGTEVYIELIQPGFPVFLNKFSHSIGYNKDKANIEAEVQEFKDNRFSL